MAYFDTTKNIIVITDWSTQGRAFTILQQHCSCTTTNNPFCFSGGWKVVLCSSRHLQDAEKNYAPIEGEALAITWCLRKARHFLLGCPHFTLLTDHKPPVNILSDKSLSSISNPRLMRMKQKTLQYTFTIMHLDGKNMFATDTLSRYPIHKSDDEDIAFHDQLEVESITIAAVCANDALSITLSEIHEICKRDTVYQLLSKKVQNQTFAENKNAESSSIKPFFHIKE